MKNLIVIHGENTYKSKKILEKILSNNPEIEAEIFNGSKIEVQNFSSDIRSMPFLADKRIVILNDFFRSAEKEEQEKIMPSLKEIPDFLQLIIVESKALDKRFSSYKTFKKIAEIYESPALTDKDSPMWLRSYIKDESINTEPGFAEYLIRQSGSFSELRLINEIKKIKAFANGNPLTKAMIKELIPESLTLTIFNLTEAISNKKAENAIMHLHEMTDKGEDPFFIFNMVVRQFRILIMVKELSEKKLDEFQIAKKISLHPYPTKLAIPQTRNFSFEKLKEIYKTLLDIEISTKSGGLKTSTTDTSEMTLTLEKLILNFCNRD